MAMKKMLSFVLILAGAYAGVALLLFLMQRVILYHPSKHQFEEVDYKAFGFQLVEFENADGRRLHSLHRPARDGAATILYFHGNAGHAGHRTAKVQPYLKAGYGVLLAEYSGYGPNSGTPDEQVLYQDAASALGYLKSRGIGDDKIILYGESLGSGVAVHLAKDGGFAALILESPFDSIAKLGKKQFPMFPINFLVRDRFESDRKITQIGSPLLVIHGYRDRIVPIQFGQALFNQAPEPKEFVKFIEAGHNDLYDHGAGGRVLEFLRNQEINP